MTAACVYPQPASYRALDQPTGTSYAVDLSRAALRGNMGERGEEASSDTVARVREVADYIRMSKERTAALESGVRALRDKTRKDLQLAQGRIEEEAARADAAEERCRELEARLSELDAVITQELLAAVDNEADDNEAERPKAGLRLVGQPLEPNSEPVSPASGVGEPPSRRRVVFDGM